MMTQGVSLREKERRSKDTAVMQGRWDDDTTTMEEEVRVLFMGRIALPLLAWVMNRCSFRSLSSFAHSPPKDLSNVCLYFCAGLLQLLPYQLTPCEFCCLQRLVVGSDEIGFGRWRAGAHPTMKPSHRPPFRISRRAARSPRVITRLIRGTLHDFM